MTDRYLYNGPPKERVFGALPEGDYDFGVLQADPPYLKNEHWVLRVKIVIKPSGITVFANPWSGADKNGEVRDGIAEFLHAIGRVPQKGAEPDWDKLVGAKGRCRLKTEIVQMGVLAGREVNKVDYWHRPHDLSKLSEHRSASIGSNPVNKPEHEGPDDVPF